MADPGPILEQASAAQKNGRRGVLRLLDFLAAHDAVRHPPVRTVLNHDATTSWNPSSVRQRRSHGTPTKGCLPDQRVIRRFTSIQGSPFDLSPITRHTTA